ncbi:hypothetical protein [Mesonia mobilis]|uniref:Uncharacterized protein n=1 Tax=Mesonia mobilis TaxID=369791 RepID=A0ABQ3C2J1_9FLAO|nr:hypothetical protein [Mesonia mobilis]MBQ0739575.1 hypothetical protein [Aquimarina celericrescens]GGZ65298.1 hypothetical protein GCM10008088_28290 [Mesonia mobilis]
MILFVDKLEKNDLGGSTTDLKKAEYILAVHGLTFKEILAKTPKNTKFPSGAFTSGKYVVMFNIDWDLKNVNFGFLNYKIDLDENFNLFADCFSPKSVAGFHTLKEQIKNKNHLELNKTKLSDNDSDFVIAYGNYIQNRS